MRTRSRVFLVLLTILAIVAFGCGQSTSQRGPEPGGNENPADTGQGSEPEVQDDTPVIIATTGDTTFAPIFVAAEKGFFAEEGVNASYKIMEGSAGISAVVAGSVHMSPNSELPSLINKDKGGEYVNPLVTLNASQQIGVVAAEDITKPEDLIGRNVGVTFVTAADYFFDRYINYHGLDREQMNVVNVNAADMVPAFVRGDIDAFFLWEPWLFRATEEREGAHVLAYSGEDDVYVMEYALNTSTPFLEEHPELVQAVVRALIKAAQWIEENPDEAAEIVAPVLRLEVGETRDLMGRMTYPMTMTQQDKERFVAVAEWLKRVDRLESDPQTLVDELFAPESLKAVAPERVDLP